MLDIAFHSDPYINQSLKFPKFRSPIHSHSSSPHTFFLLPTNIISGHLAAARFNIHLHVFTMGGDSSINNTDGGAPLSKSENILPLDFMDLSDVTAHQNGLVTLPSNTNRFHMRTEDIDASPEDTPDEEEILVGAFKYFSSSVAHSVEQISNPVDKIIASDGTNVSWPSAKIQDVCE